jgi:hypothetical protein
MRTQSYLRRTSGGSSEKGFVTVAGASGVGTVRRARLATDAHIARSMHRECHLATPLPVGRQASCALKFLHSHRS